jgi:hypothetical protein
MMMRNGMNKREISFLKDVGKDGVCIKGLFLE